MSASTGGRYEAQVTRVARGAGISAFGQGVGRVLGFATQVALARMYGTTLLGFYVLGFTVVQVADVLAQFGMSYGVVRYVARYRAEDDAARVRGTILLALGTVFAMSLMLATLIFFSAGFLADRVFHEPFLRTVFRTFAVSLPFLTVMSITLSATEGFQTVKYTTYVQEIQRPLSNLVLVVAFYLAGAQIIGAVIAYALSVAGGTALSLLYLRRLFPKLLDRGIPLKLETRALFSASAPMIVVNFTSRINSWAAVAVIGVFASASAVGIFNAAARTAALSALIITAFKIFTSMASSLYSQDRMEELRRLYQDISRWSFTGSLAIFLVTALLARDIMAVFGPGFVSGWTVLIVIGAGQLFNTSTGPTFRLLAMTGHQRIVMLATLGGTVAGVVASLALVPAFGVLGAGIAIASTTILSNAITLLFVKRLLGFWPYTRRYLKPLAAGLLTIGGAYLLKLVLPLSAGIPALVIIAPLFLAGFAALIWVFGLDSSDRQLLKALQKAIRSKIGLGA